MAPMSYSSALTGKKNSDSPSSSSSSSSSGQKESGNNAQATHNAPLQQQNGGSNDTAQPQAPPPQPPHQHQQQQQQQQSSPSHPRQHQQPTNQSRQPTSGAYTKEQYVRRAEQTPHTGSAHETHYIISLTTSSALHQTLTDLRTQHFPKHLNKLQAHIALFRALPGSKLAQIERDVATLCRRTAPFELKTAKEPFRLRQGVGVRLEGGKARVTGVFRELKDGWEGEGWLSEQDRGFQPHYTVMNKVEDEGVVQKAMGDVEGKLGAGIEGRATGLSLFEYRKGYWNFRKSWRFEGEGGEGGGGGGGKGRVPGSEAA